MKIIQGDISVHFDKQDIQDALVQLAINNGINIDDDANISYSLTAGRGNNPQHKAELHISSEKPVEAAASKSEPKDKEPAKPEETTETTDSSTDTDDMLAAFDDSSSAQEDIFK